MKIIKVLFLFFLIGIVNNIFAGVILDSLRFDLTTSAYGSPKLKPGVGGGVAIGVSTRYFNIFLANKAIISNLNYVDGGAKLLFSGLIRTELKYKFSNMPFVALGGFGLGIVSYEGGKDSASGPLLEISAGPLFTLTQHVSMIGRIYGLLSKVSKEISISKDPDIRKTISTDISGVGFDVTIRFSFGRTNRLKY